MDLRSLFLGIINGTIGGSSLIVRIVGTVVSVIVLGTILYLLR